MLIPFEVRTTVESAPGTQATNECPGPIENTPLVPVSELPANAGVTAANASPTIKIRSRDLMKPSSSASRLATGGSVVCCTRRRRSGVQTREERERFGFLVATVFELTNRCARHALHAAKPPTSAP